MTWATCSAGAVRSSPEPKPLRRAAPPSAASTAFAAAGGAAGGGCEHQALGEGAPAHLEFTHLAHGRLDRGRRRPRRCLKRCRNSPCPAGSGTSAAAAPPGASPPRTRHAGWRRSNPNPETTSLGRASPQRWRTDTHSVSALPCDPQGITHAATCSCQANTNRHLGQPSQRRLGDQPERRVVNRALRGVFKVRLFIARGLRR